MADEITFTEKESKLMASAWQCFEEKPKVSTAQHSPSLEPHPTAAEKNIKN